MKPIGGLIIAIALLTESANAQSAGDPFARFHEDLLRVARQEAAAVTEQRRESERGERDVELSLPDVIQSDAGLERLRRLKPLIGSIFDQHGVPQEFLLVGLIESGYRTNAVSPANAAGMWQFIESTARRFVLYR